MIEQTPTELKNLTEEGELIFKVDEFSSHIIQFTINGDLINEDELEELFSAIRTAVLT